MLLKAKTYEVVTRVFKPVSYRTAIRMVAEALGGLYGRDKIVSEAAMKALGEGVDTIAARTGLPRWMVRKVLRALTAFDTIRISDFVSRHGEIISRLVAAARAASGRPDASLLSKAVGAVRLSKTEAEALAEIARAALPVREKVAATAAQTIPHAVMHFAVMYAYAFIEPYRQMLFRFGFPFDPRHVFNELTPARGWEA